MTRVMIRAGRIDRPGPRSSHTVPTPKGGGVGILMAFGLGLLLTGAASGVSVVLEGLLAASCGLAAVAYLDDVLDLPFWTKLAAQALAACLAIACGFTLKTLPLPWVGQMELGAFGAPLAFCWLLFATNAMNFIDGLNGLASGVTLVACVFLACLGWGSTGTGMGMGTGMGTGASAALCLAAGIVGFLPYNFPRARIFMGDVGSQLCGFGVAALGLLAASPSAGTAAPWVMPMLLSGVLYDVALTLVSRAVRRERLTEAHRDHLYQMATRCGISAPMVSIVHWAMAAWGGACALLLSSKAWMAGPAALCLLLAPQLLWTAWVLSLTRARAQAR